MIIHVLSFNIHKGKGWRLRPTFDEIDEHLRALSPDIIFFQEILGAQVERIVSDILPHYSYGQNIVYPKNHFGNAIFSQFPIIFSENFDLTTYKLERRGLLHSIIELPDKKHLHLLCVHLGLFKKSREKQYHKIIEYMRSLIASHEHIILGGDFNDWGSHATSALIHDFGLHEVFLSQHGGYARTFPAWNPLLKLDRIYCRGLKILEAERMMEKSWRKLSDHIAIKATLEI